MMKFKKVSFEQYKKDVEKNVGVANEYEDIKIPCRATQYSAGYDFFMPFSYELQPNETIKVPTGICWITSYNYRFLAIYPRSGLGFKYQVNLCNTVGIIDADYYKSDNDGHIFIKLVNRGDVPVSLKKGEAFAQGIISEYQRVDDDNVSQQRNGGMGSSNRY